MILKCSVNYPRPPPALEFTDPFTFFLISYFYTDFLCRIVAISRLLKTVMTLPDIIQTIISIGEPSWPTNTLTR